MSEETLSSMHDARDAEDKRLLDAKEHTQLLENYVYLVQEWVAVRVRDRQAAAEVVQRVFLRLASELAAGKSYRVPYRVVVWSVVNWTARGYEWTAKEGATLPEDWDAAAPDAPEATPDELEEARIQRQARVHRLGNLTLVTGPLNSSLSNAAWIDTTSGAADGAAFEQPHDKRSALREHSVLRLNERLCRHDSWGEHEIDVRSKALTERILKTWPGPDATIWD